MPFHSPTRRQLLQISALSLAGGSVFAGSRSESRAAMARQGILIFLQGALSQHDVWDPKPKPPAKVRGPFSLCL